MQSESHFIYYIMGVACTDNPKSQDGKVQLEQLRANMDMQNLRDHGHTIRKIGDARKGFLPNDIKRHLQDNPSMRTIFINVHGNKSAGRHYLRTSDAKEGFIYTDDFYRILGDSRTDQKPLSVFISSCEAYRSTVTGASQLPVGSTIINFDEENNKFSFSLPPEAFAVEADPEENFAEKLFINTLCNMGAVENSPQITVHKNATQTPVKYSFQTLIDRIGKKNELFDGNNLTESARALISRNLASFSKKTAASDDEIYEGLEAVIKTGGNKTKTVNKNILYAAAYVLLREEIGAFHNTPSSPVVIPPRPAAHDQQTAVAFAHN